MCNSVRSFPRPLSVEAWHEKMAAAARQDARRGTWDAQRCHCARDIPGFCCYCREFDNERIRLWRGQQRYRWIERIEWIGRLREFFGRRLARAERKEAA